MRFILVSDTHFTDNPQDSYRFELFPFLAEQQKKHNTDAIIHLGDVTDKKDRHSSILVNSIIEGFRLLTPPVFILRANHDCINPDLPYFHFLNEIPGLTYCTHFHLNHEFKLAFIPHQRDETEFHKYVDKIPYWYIGLIHQTITGAIAENGQAMSGFSVPENRARALYSGDIHNPHTVGQVEYVGAPWHVKMGDSFKPRILLLEITQSKISEIELYFPAPKKLHLYIRDISEIPSLNKGDQVKITYELTASEVVEWTEYKKKTLEHLHGLGVEVYGFDMKKSEPKKRTKIDEPIKKGKSNLDYFKEFCNREKLGIQIREAGVTLLNV